MALQDNLNQLFDVPEIQRQQEAAVKFVKDYLKEVTDTANKIKGLDLSLGSAADLKGLQELIKEASALSKETAANTAKLAKAKLDDAKASTEQAKASKIATEEQIKKNKADEQSEKQSAKTAAAQAKLNNEYEIAKKKHRDLANEAKRLYFALGAESEQFKKVSAEALKMHTQLLAAESSVGQMQRQVGNYNVVGAQFNQLLREAPNFAISLRTGIMALTNNLTYFVEAIKSARAQGDSWRLVLKNIGSTMFGVVGIANAAVLAITYFSMKGISESSKAATSAEKAIKKYTEAINAAGETSRESANEEIARMQVLNAVATDTTKSMKARKRAVDEMQRLYPEYLGNIKDEALLYGQAAGEIEKITEALLMKAAAQAAEKRFAAASEQVYDLQLAQRKAVAELAREEKMLYEVRRDGYKDAPGAFGMTIEEGLLVRIKAAKDNLEGIGASLEKARENQKGFLRDAQNAGASAFDLFTPKKTPKGKDTFKQELNEWQKMQKEQSKAQFEAQKKQLEVEIANNKAIAEDENASYDTRIEALNRYHEDKIKLINATALYETEVATEDLNELSRLHAAKKISEADYLEKRKALNIKYNTDIEAIESNRSSASATLFQEVLNIEADAAQDSLDAQRKADEEKKANLKSIGDYFKWQSDAQQKYDDELTKKRLKNIEILSNAAQQAAKIYNTLQAERTENVLAGLDREQEEVQNTEVRERARAERTIQDEKAREAAILKIEAEAEDKRQQIDEKRKAAQIQQANREKALALISVIANLVVGVSKEIASKGVAGLATSAAIALYTATLTGAIAALSVPAYEHGTDNHPGGPAIVGEGKSHKGYKPELVLQKGGKGFITDGPQFLPNLAAGSKVIPMPELSGSPISQQMLNSVMLAGGGNSAKTEALLHELIAEVRNGNNIPRESSRERDGITHKSQQVGHTRYNYLRQNIYE